MKNPIAAGITLQLALRVAVTVVTVFGAVFWMAVKQNEQAKDEAGIMVRSGLSAFEDHVKSFARDYALWDAGYDAYLAGDVDWLDANYGDGITETEVSDIVMIFSPDEKIVYGSMKESVGHTMADIFTPEIIHRIATIAEDISIPDGEQRSGYLRVGNDVVMVAVARITPVSRLDQFDHGTFPYLVQGLLVNEERLAALGHQFLIEDLHLEVGAPGPGLVEAGFPVVRNMIGNPIAAIVWTPPQPGYVVLRRVMATLGIALGIALLLGIATALRSRRMANELAQSEREAVVAARTDSLTTLYNRAGFSELLDSQEYREACDRGELAIIYLDINGFKTVNDSIGHHGGDELVKSLADRLASVLPVGARFGRIGGDEFAVALIGKNTRDTASAAASALVHSLDEPFSIFGFEFHVTAAVGYAIAGSAGMTPSEVLRRADVAMYQAKNTAERDAVSYHSTMETGALERKQIETALRKALEAGGLSVAYQPIVRTADLTLAGLEALVRWNSKEFGNVSPAVFIPVAEETGLIHDVGKFVFAQVCKDIAAWPELSVAVNVSPVQLRDPNFAVDLRALVQQAGIEPQQLTLELTEGILVNNPTIAKRKLETLKEMGFGLSLDDFGTGFSSIGYLRQFPFNKLKVDRSFVRELGVNSTANALIQALVSLGDAMDLAVVAEGIENEEQLKLLRLVHCEFIQGFYISRPVSAAEIKTMIANLGDDRRLKPSLIGLKGEAAAPPPRALTA